ncbi:MAG TPA: calcium-binding protein [Sphingomicrobium sp.]|jgi:Ca2+-binding RTX toxin-like protein
MSVITGDDGDNNLVGTNEDDTINGFARHDRLSGVGGNDTLDGGTGDDRLIGGFGSDTLNGADGNDILYGAEENTALRAVQYTFSPDLFSIEGTDTPYVDSESDTLMGGAGSDILYGGAGDLIDGGVGTDELFLTFQHASTGIVFDVGATDQVVGSTKISGIEVYRWIRASEFSDRFYGQQSFATAGYLDAGAGDDIVDFSQVVGFDVHGGDGADTITVAWNSGGVVYGDSGNDIIVGASVDGGDGDDRISGSYVHGGSGDDYIEGRGDFDELSGGAGSDIIRAAPSASYGFGSLLSSDGSSYVSPGDAGGERDQLTGGAHDDRFVAGYGDRVDGGGGSDSLSFSFAALANGLSGSVTLAMIQTAGAAEIQSIEHLASVRLTDVADNVVIANDQWVIVDGGNGNDVIAAESRDYNSLLILGDAGDDVISTRYGRVEARGGLGDDLFISLGVGGVFKGESGSDTIDYRNAGSGVSVTLYAGSQVSNGDYIQSIENARGSAFADTLIGLEGANILVGRDGADTLQGNAGDDALYSDNTGAADDDGTADRLEGGVGNDLLSGGYNDYLDGGDGLDSLSFSLLGSAAGVSLNTGSLVGADFALGAGSVRNMELVLQLYGSDFADTLSLHSQAATLTVNGGGGSDVVIAASSTAVVFGGAGDDTLLGGIDEDLLSGDDGNDRLAGGLGADDLRGGSGNDMLFANSEGSFDNGVEVDILSGGAGDDFILSGYGDIVDGGDGFDTVGLSYVGATHGITGDTAILHQGLPLLAGAGTFQNVERFSDIALTAYDDKMVIGDQADPAVVRSWDGDDQLIGQLVSITMYGGNGNDLLVGSTANDVLYGEAGDDKLLGFLGSDELWGGAGSDTFYFTEVGATDRIGDLQVGLDKIDVSSIDANTTFAGDQAFTFIGSAAFSGQAGELRVYNSGGTAGFVVALDNNGDGAADLLIELGSAQVGSANLIL